MKLKELCEKNNIEYNAKNPKLSRAKLEQLFVLEKSGQNYEIVRPLSDDEKRNLTTKVKMRDTIEEMIYTSLSLVENNTLCGSIKEYYELFAIVNSNFKWFTYKDMSKKKEEFISDKYVNPNSVACYSEFAIEVDNMFRRLVKETFEKMQKELLINVSQRLVLVMRNSQGYVQSKVADNNEIEQFMRVSKGVLLEYGYTNYDDIQYRDKIAIKKQISQEMGISYFYYEYELVLNRAYLQTDDANHKRLKKKVNQLAIDKLSKSKQGRLKEFDVEMLNDCIDSLIRIKENDVCS